MMSKQLLLLLLLVVAATATTTVTANVVSSPPIQVVTGGVLGYGAGVVQYYYYEENDSGSGSSYTDANNEDEDEDNSDSSDSSACETVVLLIVGTAMSVGGYVDLAQAIVKQGSRSGSSTVVAIMDDNLHGIQKQSGNKAANVANAVVTNLSKYVPVCSSQAVAGGVPTRFFFGGHSAGGGGAMNVMNALPLNTKPLDFDVAGFIGLSPFGMKKHLPLQKHLSLHIPTLLWDFSLMSCFVCPKTAAQQVYNSVSPTVPRFFYQLQTKNTLNVVLGGDHCSYTDRGCFGMCSGGKTGRSFMHTAVAKSIDTFIRATISEQYERSQFLLDSDNEQQMNNNVKLYSGMEEVVVPPQKPEAWLVRPWVKIVCLFV